MKKIVKEVIEQGDEIFEYYSFSIIPRRYIDDEVSIELRESISNSPINIQTLPILQYDLFKLDLGDFIPVNECKYDVVVKELTGSVLWCGKVVYRT